MDLDVFNGGGQQTEEQQPQQSYNPGIFSDSDQDYEQARSEHRMRQARQAEAAQAEEMQRPTGERDVERVARRASEVLPIVGTVVGMSRNADFDQARRRVTQGIGSDADFALLARQESIGAEQQQRASTFGGRLGAAAERIPAQMAEFLLGSRLMGSVAPQSVSQAPSLLTGAAYANAGQIGRSLANLGLQTATMPSMYAEDWQRRNLEAGRDSLDVRGLPAAFGVAAVNTAILGRLSGQFEGVGRQWQGVSGTIAGLGARSALRVGSGIAEQAGADVVTSAVQQALGDAEQAKTGYGSIGDLMRGDMSALGTRLTAQALTFAAFGAMHEGPRGRDPAIRGEREYTATERTAPEDVVSAYQNALGTLARRGMSRESAMENLLPAFEAMNEALRSNPDLGRREAMDIAQRQPEGPARNMAEALAQAIPDRARATEAPPEAPRTAETGQRAPEPAGADWAREYGKHIRDGKSHETATALADAVTDGQRWQHTGTEFRDRPDGRYDVTGSDGRTYTMSHQEGVGSLDLRVAVHNAAGEEVANAGFKRNEDGTFSAGLVKNDGARGLGRAIYDYVHQGFGDIKPSKPEKGSVLAQAMGGAGEQTEQGAAFWRRNAESAAGLRRPPAETPRQVVDRLTNQHQAAVQTAAEAQRAVSRERSFGTGEARASSVQAAKEATARLKGIERQLDQARSAMFMGQAQEAQRQALAQPRAPEPNEAMQESRPEYHQESQGQVEALARIASDKGEDGEALKKEFWQRNNNIGEQAAHEWLARERSRLADSSEAADRADPREADHVLADPEARAALGKRGVEEVESLAKEIPDAIRELSRRTGRSEASIRSEIERGLSEEPALPTPHAAGEGGQARAAEPSAGPAEVHRAGAEAGGGAGPPAAAPRGNAARDKLRPQTLLSIIKKHGGISKESARDHGWDVEAMEEHVPTVFEDAGRRKGRLDPQQAAEHLINEGHLIADKTDPMLHDKLATKLTEWAESLHQDMDAEARRMEAQFYKEKADAIAEAQRAGEDVGAAQEALRSGAAAGIKDGVDEGRSRSPEEVHGQHVQAQASGPEAAQGAAPDDFIDPRTGQPRFFIPPGGRVPGPGQPGGPAGPTPPPAPSPAGGGPRRAVTGEEAGEYVKGILRHRMAEEARRNGIAEKALKDGQRYLDDWIVHAPDEQTKRDRFLTVTDAMEAGTIASLPDEVRPIAETVRRLLDEARDMLVARDLVNPWIENYIGHLWERPGTTPDQIAAMFMGKRPLAGSEAYRKARSIPTWRDGIDMGLIPRGNEWNPVKLQLFKLGEIYKSIFGRDSFGEMQDKGIAQFVPLKKGKPEGVRTIDDKLFRVFAPPVKKVREYFDAQQFGGLEEWARAQGIDVQTTMTGPPGGQQGNNVIRRFGTQSDILAHEIGHWIDQGYNLSDWTRNPALAGELRDLADMRVDGLMGTHAVTQEYLDYIRRPDEQMANMVAAYIHAPELARKLAPNAMKKLDNLFENTPQLRRLREIKPSLVLGERDQYMKLAGPQLVGHYYVPDSAATILENYLSPGLRGNRAYDAAMAVGNMLNNFQLGYSAFHLTGTGINSMLSSLALGFRMISRGDVTEGLKTAARAPIEPFRQFIQGSKVLKEWFNPGSQGAEMGRIMDFLEKGGFRADMDKFWHGTQLEKFQDAFRERRLPGIIGRALPALSELVSYPIMRIWVPRMKAGIAADMARYELSKMPGASLAQLRDVAYKSWRSVDNRLGEVVYDNMFWKKSARDAAHLTLRSVGWNVGTWNELGGGVLDIPSSIRGIQSGEGISHRLAYVGALTFGTAIMGAMYGALTGNPPQELKDYYFPRTGARRRDGSDDRVSLPTYMRDVYSLFNRVDEGPFRIVQNAWSMLKNKVHPGLATFIEMANNEDYYGAAIRNPNDPVVQQTRDELVHLLRAFVPISVRAFEQQRQSGQSTGASVLPALTGITPAPAYVTRSSEQQRAMETSRHFQLTPQERRRRQNR